ncbi:MAG: Gfo/Idh/MocA family protein [Promethearchaeota archaeon]
MDKIKIGIIGSGFIAEHHCYSFSQIADVEIVGISSILPNEAQELMTKYNIPGKPFADYKDLLKLDCDLISICLPNYLHEKVALEVLEHKKHIFIEKPLARNVKEGEAIIAAAQKAGKQIYYCENNMYAPSFVKVKEILDNGAIGQIYMGRGREHHSGPHSAWFYKKDKAGGGALIDLGIHDIACLVWFLGMDVTEVFCQTKIITKDRGEFGECEVEDNAVGILYFENGAQVTIEESWSAPSGFDVNLELYGTEGQIISNPSRMTPVSVYSNSGYNYSVEKAGSTKGWTSPVPDESWVFGYPQEMKHFIECHKEGKKPLTDGKFGLKILQIVEAMYKSTESKKIEKVIYSNYDD